MCFNCSQRNSGEECCYDVAPKRRGPDRLQGARTRGARPRDGEPARPRRRPPRAAPPPDDLDFASSPAVPSAAFQPLSAASFEPSALPSGLYIPSIPHASSDTSPMPYTPVDLLYAHSASDASTPPSLDPFSPASNRSHHVADAFGYIQEGNHSHSLLAPPESHARYSSSAAYDYQAPSVSQSVSILSIRTMQN